jgi:4-diphosphocytidyl-2-C-methyl-D-erythritol kinase
VTDADVRRAAASAGLVVEACAKLNLFLKVLGKRPDGYHEILSLAQSISLADRIAIVPAPRGLALAVEGDEAVPAGPENLVLQAATRLLGPDPVPGASLTLIKRIPHGAGLGGGSSDAAATLLALDRMFALSLSADELHRHAAALGSDVPFFLAGGTALLKGRGTDLEPLGDLPPRDVLILHPGRPLPTAAVYAQVQEPLTLAVKPARIPGFGRNPQDPLSWVRLGNDLETHAARLCPEIPAMRSWLLENGAAAASMSGSGSAVFALYDSEAAVREAAGKAARQGWKALPCRTRQRGEIEAGRIVAGGSMDGPSGGAGDGDHRRPGVPRR